MSEVSGISAQENKTFPEQTPTISPLLYKPKPGQPLTKPPFQIHKSQKFPKAQDAYVHTKHARLYFHTKQKCWV